MKRGFKVPLQRVGGPLAKITSTGIAKRIAGKAFFFKRLVSLSHRQYLNRSYA